MSALRGSASVVTTISGRLILLPRMFFFERGRGSAQWVLGVRDAISLSSLA